MAGSIVQGDGPRAVLQSPVGFFLSARLQWNALVFPTYAPLKLDSQSQQKQRLPISPF